MAIPHKSQLFDTEEILLKTDKKPGVTRGSPDDEPHKTPTWITKLFTQ
jgi:hypothetical protein